MSNVTEEEIDLVSGGAIDVFLQLPPPPPG
jgi:hypothetical protein